MTPRIRSREQVPDMGDLIVVLLAGSLAGLRDRLVDDGFDGAADLVGDLVEIADDYLTTVAPACRDEVLKPE